MIWAKYRRLLLLLIYILFFLHAALWYSWGYTGVGHLGFGEFFGTMRHGVITAGTIFSLLVFAHALLFGGLFCGWFCHWGITQDVAYWIMKKCGIKPLMAQLNSKLIPWLWFIILIAQVVLYWIFTGFPTGFSFNPSATPVWSGVPRSILLICMTTIVSGFILVFLFGERAFCRSICTFRLWFSWFERIAPHKVRQIKECGSCQLECNDSCPMGLDVAGEIKNLGHIKNPECVKCHVCIGACPNGVLQTSMKKNEFHKEGPAIVQPSTFSNSGSFLQLLMAIIALILLGYNIGGNMSLSLGFLAGFLIIRAWSAKSLAAFEVLTAALIFIGLYFKMDMNDPVSLAKGLAAISIFLVIARWVKYENGLSFIQRQGLNYQVPAPILIIAMIAVLFLGGNEVRSSILIHQANGALARQDLQSYATIMSGCAATHSDPAGAYYDLGKVNLQLRQPEKAVENFKKSIETIYKLEAVEAMLGHLMAAGEYDHWLALTNFVAEKFPEVQSFQIYKANGLAQKGNPEAAEVILQKITAQHPTNHDALISLGVIRMEQAQLPAAMNLFEKAYQIAPASSAFYLADTYKNMGKHQEAEKFYDEAIVGQPQNISFRLEQGNNYAAQNKFREAISSLKGAVALEPALAEAETAIKDLENLLAARRAKILGMPIDTEQ